MTVKRVFIASGLRGCIRMAVHASDRLVAAELLFRRYPNLQQCSTSHGAQTLEAGKLRVRDWHTDIRWHKRSDFNV